MLYKNIFMKISVIIPTYEEPKETLRETVDQFLNFENIEVIISDSSVSKIPKHSWFKKKVTIVYSPKTNISAGRNIGAKHSSNEILMFLDADVKLNSINKTLFCIKREFVYHKHYNCIILKMSIDEKYKQPNDKFFCDFISLRNSIIGIGRGECIIVKKNIFNQVGKFDVNKNVNEDTDLVKRCAPVVYPDLYYTESGRRIHKFGWLRMFYEWGLNVIDPSREWLPIGR